MHENRELASLMLSIPESQSRMPTESSAKDIYKPYNKKLLGSTQMPRPMIKKDESKDKWLRKQEMNKKGLRVKKLEYTEHITEESMPKYVPSHLTQVSENQN